MEATELYHHGIKGMKWGVRRTEAQLARARGDSSDNNPAKKKKTASEMTDDELNTKIKRLELEKRYTELAKAVSPPKSTRGKDFVLRVLERSGENIATQASAYIMGRAVNKMFAKVFNDPSIVDPKNIQKKK